MLLPSFHAARFAGVRVAVLTLLCGASACSPELDWRDVRPAQADGLVATFPCKPDAHQRDVRLPGLSRPVTLHMLSCQRADATWALSYATLADAREVTPALEGLLASLRQNLTAASGMAVAPKPLAGQDRGPSVVPRMTPHPAARQWSFQAQRPDGLGRPLDLDVQAWHFSHGLTVFQATAWRPAQAASAAGAEEALTPFARGFQFPG